MNKLKLNFFLKGDKKQNGLTAIYGKIIIGTSHCTFSTGKYVLPKRWKETNCLRNALRIDAEVSLKEHLNSLRLRVERTHTQLIKSSDGKMTITAMDFKNVINDVKPKVEQEITLLDIIRNHNKYFKLQVTKGERAKGSEEKYIRMGEVLVTFLKEKYNVEDIEYKKVDREFVFALDAYLRFEKKHSDKKGIGHNTTVKYVRNISSMVNHSIAQGLIKDNPFSYYKEKLDEVDTVYLTKAELNKIEKKTFTIRRLEVARDIFLFSCYTSYAPVDAMKLSWANVEVDEDGDKWIKTKRQKTNVKSNVPVIPQLELLLEKYKNDPECSETHRLIPDRSNSNMNAYLKEIADLCGISKNLTWYVSRHTFATTVALANGIPLEVVAEIMGHKRITQTQHYAKILESTVKKYKNNLGR
jgi:integrase